MQVVAQPDKFDWQDLSNVAWAASRITLCQSRAGDPQLFHDSLAQMLKGVTGHTCPPTVRNA